MIESGDVLRVGLVGTFPPVHCGLAIFTADVATSLRDAGHDVAVAGLVDTEVTVGDGAAFQLTRSSAASARAVAETLSADVDIVLIQHEFGIFGGVDGALLSELTHSLTVPYVLMLHTVTGRYTDSQRRALAAPLRDAALVLVFSNEAVRLLAGQFPRIRGRCLVVPHGAPPELFRPRTSRERDLLGLPAAAKVASTFGLLSPGKGVEHAIRAMTSVRHTVDDVILVVAGRTHPEVVRRSGESYRAQLVGLAEELEVDDIVVFRDWFHDVDELSSLLVSSDVFVTASSDADQIVSGALSFAVAAGLPFVSTSYQYALDMARRGCGITVGFDDPDGLAAGLTDVLTDDDRRSEMARCARLTAAAMSWPRVGQLIGDLLCEAVSMWDCPAAESFQRL